MVRRLILMRHARQSGLAATDHERPLTDEGHDQAHSVGTRLADAGLVPDRALSSTALRCRETLADVEAAIGNTIPTDFEPELYNAAPDEILSVLAGAEESAETLLLLAHNPGISLCALALAGGRESEREQLQRGFTPATIAVFGVDGPWSTIAARNVRLLRFEAPGAGAA